MTTTTSASPMGTDHTVSTTSWPASESVSAILCLLDARDDFEADHLRKHVGENVPGEFADSVEFLRLNASDTASRLSARLTSGRELWLQPVRIAWLPAATRRRGWFTNLFHGPISEPGMLRKRWIARHSPERVAVISAEGATTSDLVERHARAGGQWDESDGLAPFVAREAIVALERAERVARGARYKVARLLPGDVFANPAFRQRLADIAESEQRQLDDVTADASRYLEEMAAMQTPFTINLMIGLYRMACRSNHDEDISVVDSQIQDVANMMARQPVVFLISHKSMLDTAALSLVLFDADLPLPLTFGGINLKTPGIGALARRAGIIFLRRSFQDNPTYKSTFRRYIDYLIDKRFSLLWALEGTRSRTGKLLPPRFGLFNYVVGSITRTGNDRVAFVPVSVAYDQITEVDDYATEQRGRDKKPEGAGWMLKFFRRGKSHGRIHVRFGDALTITDIADSSTLTPDIAETDKTAIVQQLALRVAVAMNQATPITATAILTLILLAGGTRAQSLGEIQTLARAGAALIRRRRLEIVGHSNFREKDDVVATLEQLHATGIVSYFDEGIERLYSIQPEQHLKAAYYRNTAIHHFVLDALVEVALLNAAGLAVGDQIEEFYRTTERLRELFKFEFYFPRSGEYRDEIARRAAARMPDWQDVIPLGMSSMRERLTRMRPLLAHGVLRSFSDAYGTVAEMLLIRGDSSVDDRHQFLSDCLRLGRQQRLQNRVFSAESVSRSLYETGLRLASYRGLDGAGQSAARQSLADELDLLTGYLDDILHLTLSAARELRRSQ